VTRFCGAGAAAAPAASLLLFRLLLVSLLLSGCSADSDYASYWQLMKQSIGNSLGGASVTRDQAAAIPYASLGYRLNDGPQAILVLATDANGEELWTSSAHIVLLTQDGRVKRTAGLARNLGGLSPMRGPSLPAPASALEAPSTNNFSADFPDVSLYAVPITCRMTRKGEETIDLLGQPMVTARVDEECESAKPRWHFHNDYWLDPKTGFVWRSLQHIHPRGDTLEIEIFRPPG
jgi:hypothetical protein